jgi:hypothetical protein
MGKIHDFCNKIWQTSMFINSRMATIGKYRDVPVYSGKLSWIFRDIPPYSVIFRHIPWYSVIFRHSGFSQRPKRAAKYMKSYIYLKQEHTKEVEKIGVSCYKLLLNFNNSVWNINKHCAYILKKSPVTSISKTTSKF